MAKKIRAEDKTTGERCTARLKTCRNKDCQYRFEAGDLGWECPECGADRRCSNKSAKGYNVCRVHGAGGGRPPIHGKMIIPVQLVEAFNRIIDDPSLMSLSVNQAMLEARTNELLERVNDADTRGAHEAITAALLDIESALEQALRAQKVGKAVLLTELALAVGRMRAAVDPVNTEARLWREIYNNLELTRRINDTERKWLHAYDQMFSSQQVVEAFVLHVRIALKYIAKDDQAAYAREMRAYLPSLKREP